MNKIHLNSLSFLILISAILLTPVFSKAETNQSKQLPPPPISQQLMREGDFAVKLHVALGLGDPDDETAAESALGEYGIAPRNGWIADYPVTPDILGELRKSLSEAAYSMKIEMSVDEALKRLDAVSADVGIGVKPHDGATSYKSTPDAAVKYPDPTVINNYYTTEGPPIVTYYAPPPDYYYLYGWIPYPFWWGGFWFPGYFVLNDFHRPYYYGHRAVFISNHFVDIRSNRVWRVDPINRFSGRTYAGIGVTSVNRRAFISTGVPRSEQRVFNAPRARQIPGYRLNTTPQQSRPTVRSGNTVRSFNSSPRGAVHSSGGGRSGPSSHGHGGGGRR